LKIKFSKGEYVGIILPTTWVDTSDQPVIFLVGPIKGADNWRNQAIEFLLTEDPGIIIISPDKNIKSELRQYVLSGVEGQFLRRRAWELRYFLLAIAKGVVMAWLPGETRHDCKKSYAAMTRIELGELLGFYQHDKSIRFCIGSDRKFSELDTIMCDFSVFAPDIWFFSNLAGTCQEALRLAHCRKK
jgi:hypothetical protein